MKKKIATLLLLLCLGCARPAYAVLDVISMIEEALNVVEDIQNKVEQIQNKIAEIKKLATQGFEVATNCISKPAKCDLNALQDVLGNGVAVIQVTMSGVNAMKDSVLAKQDVKFTAAEGLENDVRKTYIYERGAKDDMKRLNENRAGLNGVAINETNSLFAKAATTRYSIIKEEGSLYEPEFAKEASKENLEKIVRAQTLISLYTQSRLARVLELRASMYGAESALELTQQGKENEEK